MLGYDHIKLRAFCLVARNPRRFLRTQARGGHLGGPLPAFHALELYARNTRTSNYAHSVELLVIGASWVSLRSSHPANCASWLHNRFTLLCRVYLDGRISAAVPLCRATVCVISLTGSSGCGILVDPKRNSAVLSVHPPVDRII